MNKVFQFLKKYLFTDRFECIVCGKEILPNRLGFCEVCVSTIKLNNTHFCQKCGIPLNEESEYCNICKSNKRHFLLARSAYIYENTIIKLITDFKFYNNRYLAEYLAKSLVDVYEKLNLKIDYVIASPLSKEKLKLRGFNQSEYLAEYFCNETDLILRKDLVIKTTNTNTQVNLSKKERLLNLKNAFKVVNENQVRGKNILIIDDLITTGATINELASVLSKCSANVFALAVASPQLKKNSNNGIDIDFANL